jgi:hypothetical protein
VSPDLGNTTTAELKDFVFGRQLGRGASREVYEFAPDPTAVIKYEYATNKFDNAHEWTLWSELRDTKWGDWLAPIRKVSACGTFLIQERTAPLTEFPKGFRVPSFLADRKPENFGMYRGRVVAHDYGNHRMFARGIVGVRLEKAR